MAYLLHFLKLKRVCRRAMTPAGLDGPVRYLSEEKASPRAERREAATPLTWEFAVVDCRPLRVAECYHGRLRWT